MKTVTLVLRPDLMVYKNVVRKSWSWGRFPEKHFVTLLMGENLLRKSSKIFRSGKCCPISGNVGLRFYDFASSENVREMRRNREPYRCASALLQAASRILNRERVLFSWNYTTAVERCCCVSGGENPTFQCKSRYYSAGEVTLPSCKCLHQPPEYILTAVHREAITALLCAATLNHSKHSNKVLRLDSQCLDSLFDLVQLFAFRTAIWSYMCMPFCFPSHTQLQ